jgi:hypothetical protein
VAAYREMYGYDHPTDPIGPEPSCDSPEKRAAWHAGMQALASVDGPDIRGVPDGSLWLMRDTYETETALAPKHATDQLRQVHLGAQDAQHASVRADAEAEVAGQRGDDTLAGLHRTHARSARALQTFYEHRLPDLEQQDTQYREWDHVIEGPRRIAVAADAELHRRHPHLAIAPLKSAEPDPVTEQEHEQLFSPSDEALVRPAEPPNGSPGSPQPATRYRKNSTTAKRSGFPPTTMRCKTKARRGRRCDPANATPSCNHRPRKSLPHRAWSRGRVSETPAARRADKAIVAHH